MEYNINCLNPDGTVSHIHDPAEVHTLMGDLDSWFEQEPAFRESFSNKGMQILNHMSNAFLLLDGCSDETLATLVGYRQDRYNQVNDASLVYAIDNFYEICKRHDQDLIFYRIRYEYNKRDRTYYYKIEYKIADAGEARKFFISIMLPDL